jgi:hypothetical protein
MIQSQNIYWFDRSPRPSFLSKRLLSTALNSKEPVMMTDHQTRLLLRAAAFSAAVFLIAAPAALADPAGYRVSVAQHACAADLGLNPSNGEYDACVSSLDRARSGAESRQIPGAAAACGGIGLNAGSRAFDQCTDNLRATLWNAENLGAR